VIEEDHAIQSDQRMMQTSLHDPGAKPNLLRPLGRRGDENLW